MRNILILLLISILLAGCQTKEVDTMKQTKLPSAVVEAKEIIINYEEHNDEEKEKAVNVLNNYEKPKYRALHVDGVPSVTGIREYYTYENLKIEICKFNGKIVYVRET